MPKRKTPSTKIVPKQADPLVDLIDSLGETAKVQVRKRPDGSVAKVGSVEYSGRKVIVEVDEVAPDGTRRRARLTVSDRKFKVFSLEEAGRVIRAVLDHLLSKVAPYIPWKPRE